jgi:hypothetical protein
LKQSIQPKQPDLFDFPLPEVNSIKILSDDEEAATLKLKVQNLSKLLKFQPNGSFHLERLKEIAEVPEQCTF